MATTTDQTATTVIKLKIGVFDATQYPILVFTPSKVEPSTEEAKELFQIIENYLDKTTGNFVMIIDGANAAWIDSEVRVEFGKEKLRVEKKYHDRFVLSLYVIPNIIVSAMHKAINIVSRSVLPQEVHQTKEKAITAAKKALNL